MSILVLAEHNNSELKLGTLSAITAASEINEIIDSKEYIFSCKNSIKIF